jgi:ubiquinone/menaquinone biosynthesis C-methylase UbiE
MTQVVPDYYLNKKYLSLERFISYFYQMKGIQDLPSGKILFIGVGDGAVPYLLKKNKNYEITTFDFDSDLKPDVVGDVRSLPFIEKSFDLVCAFEVLEHLPYKEAKKALKEIARVSKKDVLISVPYRRTGFELILKFPFIRSVLKKDFLRLAVRLPVRFPGFAVSGQHYWEIDGYTLSLGDFKKDLEIIFKINEHQTPVLDFYKIFFRLSCF